MDAATTRDEVLDDGQLVQRDSKVNLLARVPDRLSVEINSPTKHRFFFYDGKNFTIFAQRVNYYATVPAPPTVGKLAAQLDEKYGIQIPLVDLFYRGGKESKEADIKSATDVGPSEVGGVTCEHYAFPQEGLDWQVWIQMGDYPLPLKLVLTTLTDYARPQYTAVYTWNLAHPSIKRPLSLTRPKKRKRLPSQKKPRRHRTQDRMTNRRVKDNCHEPIYTFCTFYSPCSDAIHNCSQCIGAKRRRRNPQ